MLVPAETLVPNLDALASEVEAELDQLAGQGNADLTFQDGRYQIYDESLRKVIEIHPDGRRYLIERDGLRIYRGAEL